MRANLKKIAFSYLFMIFTFSIIWGSSFRVLSQLEKVKGTSTTLSSFEIISLTNLERSKLNLSTLKPSEALSKAAILKANDMFEREYFSHLDSEGNGSWKLIENEGYTYHHAGENLARNFTSADSLLKAWIESDAHRNNLLNQDYTDIGVAVLENNDQVYIVQLLASPLPLGSIDPNEFGANFSFSSPLSGRSNLDLGMRLPLISFFISLVIFVVIYKLFSSAIHRHLVFHKPDIKHWRRK